MDRAQRSHLYLALAGAWATDFGAMNSLPTLDFFSLGGRPIDPAELNRGWMEVFSGSVLAQSIPGRILEGQLCRFHEYGAYIGILFGSFAFVRNRAHLVRTSGRSIAFALVETALLDSWLVGAPCLHVAVKGGQSVQPWFETFTRSGGSPSCAGHRTH